MNIKLTFIVVFCLSIFTLVVFPNDQKTVIDSLLTELAKYDKDTNEVDILNDIAWKISRSYPDSSLNYANEANELSEKLNYKIGSAIAYRTIGSIYRNQGDYVNSAEMYFKSLEIYEELSNHKQTYYALYGKTGIGSSYNGLGLVEWRLGNYTAALDYFFKSIEIFKELDDSLGIANCFNNIGLIHWNQENLDRAIEYFKKAQEIYAGIDHKNGMGNSFNNIGIIYKNQQNYDKAIEYYQKSLAIYTELNDRKGMSSVTNNLGMLYFDLGNYTLAKEYNDKGFALYKERNDKYGIAMALGNYFSLYNALGDSVSGNSAKQYYQQALNYAFEELKTAKEIGALSRIREAYEHLSIAHENLRDFENALIYYKEFIEVKDSLFSEEKNKQIEEAEARFNSAQKQQEIEKQKIVLKRQKTIRDSLIIFSLLIIIVAILIFSRFLLKKKTNKLLEEKNNELQEIILELNKLSIVAQETDNAVIIMDASGNFEWVNAGFTKLYGYTFNELVNNRGSNILHASENPEIKDLIEKWVKNKKPIHYETRSKKKTGEDIWVQTTINPVLNHDNEIEKIVVIDSDITDLKNAEKEILQWKEDITDSIAYAKRIQEAVLPSQNKLNTFFDECFILYQPKDIVSGDFYWFSNIDNKIIVVAADCTGHGVPGAFMSLIGITFLNRIINEQKIIEPDIILNKLHENIMQSLHKNNYQETNDGLDISVIMVDTQKSIIEFAGAMNSIYIIRNDSLEEYKANIATIGVPIMKKDFDKKVIPFEKNDKVYLFTDGFADQFGGPDSNKLKYQQFKKILLESNNKPLPQQKEILWKYFQQWQGNYEQIDDILVLGIKL